MKYHSRSPEEVRKHIEESDTKSSRKRTIGRIILLLDLVLVVAILFYFTDTYKEFTAPENMAEKSTNTQGQKESSIPGAARSFTWKNLKVEGSCLKKQSCMLVLKGSPSALEVIDHFTWELTNAKRAEESHSRLARGKEPVVLERRQDAKNAKKLTKEYNLQLPNKLSSAHRLKITFLDTQNMARLSFRLYP